MGVSYSGGELAKKLGLTATSVAAIPTVATRQAALFQREVIVGISPRRLRNVGRNGARLGVKIGVTGTGAGAIGRVRATGPWQIIEFDTKAHVIPKARRRNPKMLRMPDGRIVSQVNHPGTKGKHLFAKGAAVARPVIPKIYEREIALALGRVFR